MSRTVPVLVPLPLDVPFDYAIDHGSAPQPGDYVAVPFGPREVVGVVWDAAADRRVAAARLKAVRRKLDAPPMPRPLRALVRHVAAVTLHPLGSALKLALSVPAALE
ncbi:MAG: primosomal protein N', partial [Geminicoccaceae bacterium]